MILKAFSSQYFKELKTIRKKPIIFFNGCFDIVHLGHLELINYVKEIKSRYTNNAVIVCGINSDGSVKLQDKKHPLINEDYNRAKFMDLLGIDYAIIFDEKSPLSLLMSIMPDEVVTTTNYHNNPNYEDMLFCKNHEIKVSSIVIKLGFSTTNIYNKIEQQVKEKIINEIKA